MKGLVGIRKGGILILPRQLCENPIEFGGSPKRIVIQIARSAVGIQGGFMMACRLKRLPQEKMGIRVYGGELYRFLQSFRGSFSLPKM